LATEDTISSKGVNDEYLIYFNKTDFVFITAGYKLNLFVWHKILSCESWSALQLASSQTSEARCKTTNQRLPIFKASMHRNRILHVCTNPKGHKRNNRMIQRDSATPLSCKIQIVRKNSEGTVSGFPSVMPG
jgi:hypothetical protein